MRSMPATRLGQRVAEQPRRPHDRLAVRVDEPQAATISRSRGSSCEHDELGCVDGDVLHGLAGVDQLLAPPNASPPCPVGRSCSRGPRRGLGPPRGRAPVVSTSGRQAVTVWRRLGRLEHRRRCTVGRTRSPARPSQSGISQARRARRASGIVGDRGRVLAEQHVRAELERDRPLGVRAQREARHAERRGLLLDAAGVGDDRARRRARPRGSRCSRAARCRRPPR